MSALARLDNVQVVLVNTSHPGNIGACARAMKNMGLRQLTLVNPREFPSDTARWRAVSAADIVDGARVASSLSEAIADCVLVVATSARSRSMPWPVLDPRESARQMLHDAAEGPVAVVLGREDTGLSNEELSLCNYHVQIPADEQYSSLNLAAAAMVLLYELRMAALADEYRDVAAGRAQHVSEHWDVPRADARQMERFYEHLETVLVELDFHDRDNPRLLMSRMRRLFGRIRPDRTEVNILRGILTHIQKSLRR